MGALNVLVAVLAARFVVLVAVAGGIALAWNSIAVADPWRLGTLAVYALTVVIPCVVLAMRR